MMSMFLQKEKNEILRTDRQRCNAVFVDFLQQQFAKKKNNTLIHSIQELFIDQVQMAEMWDQQHIYDE